MTDYQENWEKFWKEICTNPDGTLNLDAIQRELHDFSNTMTSASAVYMTITNGAISKPNADPKKVLAYYEDDMTLTLKEMLKYEQARWFRNLEEKLSEWRDKELDPPTQSEQNQST